MAYSVDIRIKTTGSKQLDSVVEKVNKLNGVIKSLKPVPDLFQKQRGGTEAFRQQINAVKKTLADTLATFGQVGKVTGFSKTIGGLNSQLAGFRSVANSAKVGSKEFTNALIAGENASRQLLKAELDRLNSLRSLYQTNAKLATGSSVGIGKQLTEVLKIGKTIPNTIASLNEYKSVLNGIIQLVDIGSKEYNELELAIQNVNKRLQETQKTPVQKELRQLNTQVQLEKDLARQREKNQRERSRTAKQQRQGRLLGAGFPLLFGGGVGSIAGSLAGSFTAKPGEEFGAQIFGSAIGAQLETLIKRANALGDAIREISFEKLEEQSIIINGELRAQIELLKELGEADKARAALAKEVQKRTGASADVSRDINRSVQLLNAGFSELVNSAGTTLGILAGPFLTAIGAISAGIAASFKTFNNFASNFRKLLDIFPKTGVIDKFFEKFDKNLQKSTAEAKKLKRELNFEIGLQDQLFKLQQQQKVGREGRTIEGQKFNLQLKRKEAELKNSEAKRKALANQKDDDVRLKINEKFNNKLKNDLAKINKEETLLVETQNQKVKKLLRVVDLKNHENSITEKIMKANREGDIKTAARLKFERDKVKLQFALGEKLREAKNVEEEIALIKQHMVDIDKLRLNLAEKLNLADPIKAQTIELDQQMRVLLDRGSQVVALSQAISSSFEQSFTGIINGTMSIQDAFRNMLNSIANHFINTAAKMAANQLQRGLLELLGQGIAGAFSFGGSFKNFGSTSVGTAGQFVGSVKGFPTFADGGRPPVGRASIVGERGPELFVPNRSGTIIPNNRLGGGNNTSVVVNVDASGSDVQGDEEQATQFGSAIATAIQSELIRQQRPGGLLSR